MYRNYHFNNMDEGMRLLCGDLLSKGEETGSRNGACKELTHVGVTYEKPWQREIINPARKANIAAQIVEGMWILAGRNDIDFLSHYLPRAADFSDDGETWRAGYGPRIRKWAVPGDLTDETVDQLAEVVRILKSDPSSRRAVMSIFDPAVDFGESKDIPCNNWLTFTSRLGRLDLHVAIRSNDLIWGHTGVNVWEWSVLQEIVAGMLGVEVGAIHFSITSLHTYSPHWAKAQKIASSAYSTQGLVDSPRLGEGKIKDVRELDVLLAMWFNAEKTIREQGPSEARWLVENFPEPMMKSWLRVLQWWWSNDTVYIEQLRGTRLFAACMSAILPKPVAEVPEPVFAEGDVCPKCGKATTSTSGGRTPLKCIGAWCNHIIGDPIEGPEISNFLKSVFELHCEKDKAYGTSWKKRGESFSIIPNIARKVDRLVSGADTSDENQVDTAIDLMVYLAKYHTWLDDEKNDFVGQHPDLIKFASDDPHKANEVLAVVEREEIPGDVVMAEDERVRVIWEMFESLLVYIAENRSREDLVWSLLHEAYELARHRWESTETKKPGGPENPLCNDCGSAKSNHGPGNSRSHCTFQDPTDAYRGADVD